MANPQVEQGYIRIANEIYNECIRRDFSKRQLNIILLILRLSYGCRKKYCEIPKLNYFEVAGINKVDIKKELKFLKSCKVINWDEEKNYFSLNKDFEKWQVSPVKNWDDERFKFLISYNLKVSKTLTNDPKKVSEILTEEPEKVSKTLTKQNRGVSKTLTFKGEKVSKTLTTKLVKYELRHPLIACLPRARWVSKDIIKDIINKDIKDINNNSNPFQFYENNFGMLPPILIDNVNYWISGNFFEHPEEIIIESMKEAVKANKRSWQYCEKCLVDWNNNGLKTINDVQAYVKNFHRQASYKKPIREEAKPDWLKNRDTYPEKQSSTNHEEAEQQLKQLLEKYNDHGDRDD